MLGNSKSYKLIVQRNSKMARQTWPPLKLSKCVIGAEIDSMIDDAGNNNDDHEDPKSINIAMGKQCDI